MLEPMVTTTDVHLDAFRYALEQRVSGHTLRRNARAEVVLDHAAMDMVARLDVLIAGSRPCEYTETLSVPADWWSHFKLWAISRNTWWARWWVRRLKPPEMVRHTFTAEGRMLFPDIPISLRDTHKTVVVVSTELREEFYR